MAGMSEHMTTGGFDAVAPEPAGSPAGEPRVFDHVCRLVPASGLQFIDAAIDARRLPGLRAWFTEDEIETAAGTRRVLLPLSSETGTDGTTWHPVTFKPLGPNETLSFTGLEALEPYLDRWMPVPFLRYLGRAETGASRYDQGPTNWARVFIAKPAEGLRGADQLKAVFAFDTRLDTRSRADQHAYLAPNADDALFASTFMLADAPETLADFLSQPWIDAWLRETGQPPANDPGFAGLDESGFVRQPDPGPVFALAHVARYLTFLKILKRTSTPPQIRFVDSISKTLPIVTAGLDLVIDFGAAETTALLINRKQELSADIADAARHAIPLRLRDLSNPTQIHTGPIPTVVEFDHQTFGNAALSRRSGRPDAFAWTSLVRIGVEAQRLALRVNATDGITGLSDIGSGLDQTQASDGVWRFSTPDTTLSKAGPMVTGETLRHVSETGDLVARLDQAQIGAGPSQTAMPAMRPRFSGSALVGFFIVELLLHAISEINSAAAGSPLGQSASERNDIRQIERIIVTSPIAMSPIERRNLIERVRTAIDLVWLSQHWDQPGHSSQPIKPELSAGIGPDVGVQLVYLLDEVRNKFSGTFSELVDCVRRRTGDPDARDNLRISSMDLSRRAAGLTVIDYDVAHDGTVQAGLVLADRTGAGGERVIEAIVETHIMPAIAGRLAACGVPDAHAFVPAFIAGNGDQSAANLIGKRFVTKILRPAAIGVFETYAGMPRRGAEGLRCFRLDNLVAAGGGRLDPIAAQFEAAASAAGATKFSLAAVTFEIGRRHVQHLVETELWPMVSAMTDAIHSSECDILLMGGDLAHLPDLLDHVLSCAPVPAGRIVVLDPSPTPPKIEHGGRNKIHDGAVLGAYMANRNLLVSEGFSLVTRDIAQALAHDGRAHPGRPLMPGAIRHAAVLGAERALAFKSAPRDRNLAEALLDDTSDPAHFGHPAIERMR